MELHLVVSNRVEAITIETTIELPFVPRIGDSIFLLDAPDKAWLKDSNAEMATVTVVNYSLFDYENYGVTVFAKEDK